MSSLIDAPHAKATKQNAKATKQKGADAYMQRG
jgi:hypothetical protein